MDTQDEASGLQLTAEEKQSLHQREQIRCHDLWDKWVENSSKLIHYEKTAVMMLSWEDSDLNKELLEEEVSDLGKVFKDVYGFEVERKIISSKHSPEKWLTNYLSNFVCTHDEKNTLLIIYYAGHGWSNSVGNGDGPPSLEFHLGDKATKEAARLSEKCRVAWHNVERILTGVDHADILGIFDCCDAGSLTNLRGPLRFEYLGACEVHGLTQPASESSFTRALIWALKKFATFKKPFFSVGQLRRKIVEAPHFPKDQWPTTGQRFDRPDSIILAPKMALVKAEQLGAVTRAPSTKPRSTGGVLNLQFQFDSRITDEMMKDTAKALHQLITHERISAKRITFLQKHEIVTARWGLAFEAVKKKKLVSGKDRRYLDTPPPENTSSLASQPAADMTSITSAASDQTNQDSVVTAPTTHSVTGITAAVSEVATKKTRFASGTGQDKDDATQPSKRQKTK